MATGTVYSERFILATTPGVTTYTVPAHKRAIVKFVSGVNGGPSATNVALMRGPDYIWVSLMPAGQGAYGTNLLIPYYAGEVIGFYSAAAVYGVVAGYLFEDPTR